MINITYTPDNISDFEQAVQILKDSGLGSSAKVAAPAITSAVGDGPNVARWKEVTGKKKFRLTNDERSSGVPVEEIAADRLAALGETTGSEEIETVALPDDDGLDVFGEE